MAEELDVKRELSVDVVQTDKHVVRIVEREDGLWVYAHHIVDGKIWKPLAYMLGSNALWMKPPSTKK